MALKNGEDLNAANYDWPTLAEVKAFHDTVRGNVLVVTSPYTWLEEFTKKENALSGVRPAGEAY